MNFSTTYPSPPATFPAFIEALEQKGIRLSADTWLRVYRMLEKNENPARLKLMLCPLIVSSPDEQTLFYEVFDQFFTTTQTPETTFPEKEFFDREKPPSFEEEEKILPPEPPREPDQPRIRRPYVYGAIAALAGIVASLAVWFIPDVPMNLRLLLQIFLLLLAGVGVWIYRLRQRKLVARRIEAKEPPWFWNIDLKIRERLDFGAELPILARQLRRRLPGNHPHLNLRATINETLRSGGALTLRYDYRTRPAEYLFLIDQTSFADHRRHLYEMLYKELLHNNVYAERFFYTDDLRVCWNEKHPGGISLEKIALRYADYRLIIFGDAWKMINPVSGLLMNWTQVFDNWENRALMTSRPTAVWGYDELRLAERFVVLPANPEGLLRVIDYLEETQKYSARTVRNSLLQPVIQAEAGELKKHFSPSVQTWIAACAIYPEVNWDLTLYLGEFLSVHVKENLLTFANLVKIAQLSWFRNGRMPDKDRGDLLNTLDKPLRLTLHQKMVDALEEQFHRSPVPVVSAAYSEFRLQLAVHKLESGNFEDKRKTLQREIKTLIEEGVKNDFIAIQSVAAPGPLDVVIPPGMRSLAFAPAGTSLADRLRKLIPSRKPREAKPEEEKSVPPTPDSTDVEEAVLEPVLESSPTSIVSPTFQQTFPLPEMVFIKGGTFDMGSEKNDDEKPIHKVMVSDFWLGRTTVTVREFAAFVEKTNFETDADKSGESNVNSNENKSGLNWRCDVGGNVRPESEWNHPVIHVSWNDAKAYCDWLSGQTGQQWRLPMEAEWEYAAGGGSTERTEYAGTNDVKELSEYAWYSGNSNSQTHPVGQKKPNRLGLYDMSGNVWEWCSDWYGSYPSSDISDPQGSERSTQRVRRGGSWCDYAERCRVSGRYSVAPVLLSRLLGFRLARIN